MKNTLLFFILFFSWGVLSAQQTQTLRGMVVDSESKFPLIGVSISVTLPGGELLGTTTDIDGIYKLEGIPLGRQEVMYKYLGYQEVIQPNVLFTSAKEVIMDIEMEESIAQLTEVVVVARESGEVVNEMATVSAREFSVQETNRYAGSRGEPARMASNYAGIQGADDSRNDIIVRGNSPQGVLWRLDGVNIPNPNHFAIPGTGGGPVSILNNKFLANSDFFTGAFPAEYGNGIAGVFDLKMRNGNNAKHEFSGQLGFFGTELTAEGPINKEKRSSYLAMYRYSTLQLFSFMGIQVGTDAIPRYQDGAFRLNFPGKGGSNFAVFGMGGISDIDIVLSDAEKPDTTTLIYGSNDRDQYFGSTMGVVGASYTKPINNSTFVKATVAASHSRIDADHDMIFRHVNNEGFYQIDSLPRILDYTFRENKYSAYIGLNKKVNTQFSLKAGINLDYYDMYYQDSARTVIPALGGEPATIANWQTRWDADDQALMAQPYIQFKYRINEKFTMTGGLTALYFGINKNSFSPYEPRIGLSYQIDEKQKISFGSGLHSQITSPYLYYYHGDQPDVYNLDMGLFKSWHGVLAYDRKLGQKMRMKFETYYQYLYEIPVTTYSSSFSLINSGSGFSRLFPDELVNEGTGRNYGAELTIEKFFSDGYYFLATASVFDAKYKGSDGVSRNTTFNGKYATNALFAKEFTFKNNSALTVGGKVTYSGGRWYGPVDDEKSAAALEVIYKDETVNTLQFKPYFRADAKIDYRINAKRFTHTFAIDLVNVAGTKNILTLTYAPDHPSGNPVREEYQLGFLPVFYYKIDF